MGHFWLLVIAKICIHSGNLVNYEKIDTVTNQTPHSHR